MRSLGDLKAKLRLPGDKHGLLRDGNSLGKDLNMTWAQFHEECKSAYAGPPVLAPDAVRTAQSLREDGFAQIGHVECDDLSKAVFSEFQALRPGARAALPSSTAVRFAPQMTSVLQQVAPWVEAYYGSHFQPYWIQFQLSEPRVVTEVDSTYWHIDDNPRQLMKLFLYLNDVYESNAAFRALNYVDSRSLFREGFRSWSVEARRESQDLVESLVARDPNAVHVLEGKSGTVLMFDNNLVHKGTPPKQGYRVVAQIEVYPSKQAISADEVAAALASRFETDYPADPWLNDHAGSIA